MFVDIQSFLWKICFALNLSSGFPLHWICLHEAPCCFITQYIAEKFKQTSFDWLLVLGVSNNRWASNSALKSCLKNKIIRIYCLQNDKISCDLIRWLWNFLFSITILSQGQISLGLCYLQLRKNLLFLWVFPINYVHDL